ncbi:50S ribosome-binding GTPase [bacterium]|nr:50S ribosome-binding GTPase [bacterium]
MGNFGKVSDIQVDGLLYRRLLDLGIVKGAQVKALFASPSGDPIVYRIRGANIAIRKSDAYLVQVVPDTTNKTNTISATSKTHCSHCFSSCGHQIDEQDFKANDFTVALAGNSNTGKSTVFNALTGLRQHVGNWPGKTVMRAEGKWRFQQRTFQLVDLPGTYSLLSNSVEEEIARDFILFGKPDCTVIVVDATCLERNLNLVVQILQITSRVVVCVNLIDEAMRKGIVVDTEKLMERLGAPVVATAARRKQGLLQLQEAIYEITAGKKQTNPVLLRFDNQLEDAIDSLTPYVEKALPQIPNPRWIAMRLLDGGDVRLMEELRDGILSDLSGLTGKTSLPSGIAVN